MNCTYCNRLSKNKSGLAKHELSCKSNPNRKPALNQFSKAKNLGLEIPTFSAETRLKFAQNSKRRGQSEETKKKLSNIAKDNGLGGHTSKIKKSFQKKDGSVVYLQSSYELKMAFLLEENDIKWTRPSPLNWIDDAGSKHRYYPDFEVSGVYFDTKNDFLIVKDELKIKKVIEQNNIDLYVISKDNINLEFILSKLPNYP